MYVPIAPIGDMLRRQAYATPDAPALWFEGESTTYAELDAQADRTARALDALGLAPQTRVAYLAKNSDRYLHLLFGAARAGLVVASLNWRLAPPELAFVINDAAAEVLVVGRDFADVVRSLDLPTVKTVIALDGDQPDWPAFDAWRDAQPADPFDRAASDRDVVLQLYTSGTTGLPKGAMLTSRSLMAIRDPANGEPEPWNAWGPDDVCLVAMPMFHIAGTGTALDALLTGSGALAVILREFSPAAVLDLLAEQRLTKMFLVPAALQAIVREPRAREIDFGPLAFVIYGASPMPTDLLKTCLEIFRRVGFTQVYGLTEVSGYTVTLEPADHLKPERLASAGRVLPGVELAVVDAEGARLPPGETGEVLMRGDTVMAGYWNRPEATAEAIDADGWFRTGDAGYLDADGYLYLQDRIKDMIVSGGENVYPVEVENAIFGCPGVADVAVIGVPDARWGEAVKAVVVRSPGAEIGPAEVLEHARARIAGYKVPKSVDFIDALPRNASGKVLRRQLREPYWDGVARRVN